ncbi:MAG: hypothetical protein R6U25_06520 [Alkalispirochaeta sp.]
MTGGTLRILKGYGRLLRAIVAVAVWIAGLGMLSALITLPLWFLAAQFPTIYTTSALIVLLAALTWLLVGGRRPTAGTLFWVAEIALILTGLALGWYVVTAVALVIATGVIAHRLA